MREAKIAPTLVNECIERTRLPWPQAIGAAGLTLLLLLIGAAYLDGALSRPFDGAFWRLTLLLPAFVLYCLSAYHLLIPVLGRGIKAFRSLVGMADDAFDQLAFQLSTVDRRREWVALGVGAVVGLLPLQLWNGPETAFWLKLYWFGGGMVVNGIIGWSIYMSLFYVRLITELSHQPLDFDIFDPKPLEPIAHWGLAVSVSLIGGITLLVLAAPNPRAFLSVEWIVFFGAVILVSVVAFFLPMMGTHRVMSEAKERELGRVRQRISTAYKELNERTDDDQLQDMEALSDSITAWLAYEKRIGEAAEWPYTADTIRNLLMSTLLPIFAWIAQVIVEFIT